MREAGRLADRCSRVAWLGKNLCVLCVLCRLIIRVSRGTDGRRLMKTNEILEDIYRIREEHARDCSYEVTTIFARMRDHLKELEAQGGRVVSPEPRENAAAGVLREEPPKPVQTSDS